MGHGSRQLIRAEIVINKWLASSKIEREFHFKELKSNDELVEYQTFVNLMLETAPLVSFKKISVVKSGITNIERAFEQLFFRLVEDGIRHEDSTGRAVLPRRLFFVKDAEAEGSDEMLLSRLKDRLTTAFPRKGDRKLVIDKLSADDSRGQHFLQMADLFTSSLNRVATREATSNKAKDVFADWFIERIASLVGTNSSAVINGEGTGDLVVSLSL